MDDEQDYWRLVQNRLIDIGCEVHPAYTYRGACEWMDNNDPPAGMLVDLIVNSGYDDEPHAIRTSDEGQNELAKEFCGLAFLEKYKELHARAAILTVVRIDSVVRQKMTTNVKAFSKLAITKQLDELVEFFRKLISEE